MDWAPIPTDVEARLREICLALPETTEEQPYNGFRWMIRRRNFCQVFALDEGGAEAKVMIVFRSDPPEHEVLAQLGHPFFAGGWGNNVMGMILDDAVDWTEVAELLCDSYCIMAPKKLAALVSGQSTAASP